MIQSKPDGVQLGDRERLPATWPISAIFPGENNRVSTYHDSEQIMQHLSAQDAELLRHAKMLIHLLEKKGISLQQLEAEVGKTSQLEAYTSKLPTNAPIPPTHDEGEKSNT